MIKLNKTDWLEWIGKRNWTYIEAVAISIAIHPDNLTIKMNQTTGDGKLNEDGSLNWDVINTFRVELKDCAASLGKSSQDKLNHRLELLMVGKTPKAPHNRGLPINPAEIAGTPAKLISRMLFEEWDLPKELKSIDVSSIITHEKKPVDKVFDEKELSSYEKRKAKIRQSLASNSSGELSFSQIGEHLGISRATLSKLKKELSFPKPINNPTGNQKAYYNKEQVNDWWNNR